MSKLIWKGATLVAPVPPTLVSCGTVEKPNVLTVAWCGIVNSQPPKTYVSIRPERYSYDIIKNSKSFVINMVTTDMVRAVDFCGVRSGRDVDKFKHCKLTAIASQKVTAPTIKEATLSFECKVTDIIPMGSHDMFLADIVSVSVEDNLLSEDGKLHISRAKPIAYAHGSYYKLGAKLGGFGFSVKKKGTSKKR